MKNRERPYIPLYVKIAVAERQVCKINHWDHATLDLAKAAMNWRGHKWLTYLLNDLAMHYHCAIADLRLDHTLALRLRDYNPRKKDIAARYTPNANDPAYLAYLPNEDHHHKTNRRNGAQFSDVTLIKRERKREKRALGMVKRKAKIPSRPFSQGRSFPSRP